MAVKSLHVSFESMGIETKIENANLLTDIFGCFPSFHDAEVLRITLDRGDRHDFDLAWNR